MKNIIVGVTSSIAAYKSVQLVSDLIKKGYIVEVIMSKNACEFIKPLTFSSLTKNKTYVDTFDREVDYNVEHISLADKADVFIIVPASANIIAKVCNGICDDMLSTTFLACDCQKIIAPAMNTKMWNNPITKDNIQKCKSYGIDIIEPINGKLACDTTGVGKLADIDTLIDRIEYHLQPDILKGKKILITSGATKETIDPVRFITNHSSGKQGESIARAAYMLKGDVTLITTNENYQHNYIKTITVTSANDLYTAVKNIKDNFDIIIMVSAVSDYTITNPSNEKIKKDSDKLTLKLSKTKDILQFIGENKKVNQILVGFCMETNNLLENARKKLKKKNCDLIVANSLCNSNTGFKSDTNKVFIVSENETIELPLLSKEQVGYEIFNYLKENNKLC